MVNRAARRASVVLVAVLLAPGAALGAQEAGSIRGVVIDDDFDAPLPAVRVLVAETGLSVVGSDAGDYLIQELPPGRYTLVFSKEGYARLVRAEVVVIAGRLTEIDVRMAGDFTEMEEFVVEDLRIGGGSEIGLLRLRLDSPALIDAVGADLMSRAGTSDAASALRLVSGATVQDGKFAVIRGLPDRYVVSLLNGVRLPSADEDRRAVELDQFPAAVIESIRVSKTFTPDQQGDASGGAVDVVLKGIPDENAIRISGQVSMNSQVSGRDDFLTYSGGGVNAWGDDRGGRDIPDDGVFGGAAGVDEGLAPIDSKWSISAGGRHVLDNGVRVGGFATFFYERDSSFFDNGVSDSWWVTTPGGPMVPETSQGTPQDGDFKTALFDVTQGSQSVQWGGLGTAGIETDGMEVGLTYFYSRTTEDKATLAEDTRGKEYFFPGYDPNDPAGPGNGSQERDSAPYIRTETLDYTERTVETFIIDGRHELPFEGFGLGDLITFERPEIDWRLSSSSATLYQPDKRQFGSIWLPESLNPGSPPFLPPFVEPATHRPYKPAANFTLGNFQRIWKEIDETSDQIAVNLKMPFEQWGGLGGYLKLGLFDDRVNRTFDQETFSNFNDNSASLEAPWEVRWSSLFPFEDHPITAGPPFVDVDYVGDQRITASYLMADLPLADGLNLIGGARWESTDIAIENIPEENATWFPPGALQPVALFPGAADVDFEQSDLLPSVGLVWRPLDGVTFRGSYSETIARQTFKELTPILQQEFLGGPVFIGNPELQMSALRNFDLRGDWAPYEGGLFSISWFRKEITDPIEYVQRVATFTYTTPVNYPEGELSGWEFELRQDLGRIWEPLTGIAIGANATLIDSEVTIPLDEQLALATLSVPRSSRAMTAAPDYLLNLYLTWDIEATGTQFSVFYNQSGDSLVSGAGVSDGNFVPDVFQTAYDTLNLGVTQSIGKYLKLQFQVKNLTNPAIQTVYRSDFIGDDVLKTSYTKGIEYAITLKAEIPF